MRNLKKLLIGLTLIAILICGAVIYSLAADVEYTGSLDTANAKLVGVISAKEITKKYENMKYLVNYAYTNPLDPEQDGYDDFLEKFNQQVIVIFEQALAELNETKPEEQMPLLLAFGNHVKHLQEKASYCNLDASELKNVRTEVSKLAMNYAHTYLLPVTKDAAAKLAIVDGFYETRDAGVAATIPELNTALRNSSLTLRNFVELCVDPSLVKGDALDLYNLYLTEKEQIVFTELKSLVATYYSYEIITVDMAHARLNTTSDRIESLIKKNGSVKNNAQYESIMVHVNAIRADITERNEAMKEIAQFTTPLEEYAYGDNVLTYNFDTGSFPYAFNHANTGDGLGNESFMNTVSAGNNKYLELIMGKSQTEIRTESGVSSRIGSENTFIDFGKFGDTTLGYVFECDVMSYDDTFTSLEFMSAEYAPNVPVGSQQFRLMDIKDGAIYTCKAGARDALLVDDLFAPGEWTHLTICYTPDDGTGKPAITVYVDYEWIGVWWDASGKLPYKMSKYRIRPSAAHSSVCFDNFETYKGTSYRDRSKFSGMSADDMFKFYVDVMMDERYSFTNRSYAMAQAQAYYDTAKEKPALAEYVTRFDDYAKNENVVLPTRDYVYGQLSAIIETLNPFGPTTSENVSTKLAASASINKFMTLYADYIDLSEPRIVEINNRLQLLLREAARINNVAELVYSLQRFDRALTYTALMRHYEAFNEWYNAAEFYDLANYEAVKEDPVIVKFEEAVGKTVPEYIGTMQEKIRERNNYERGVKVVDCVNIIIGMEGYEDTEAFWSANYDFVNKYVLVIREIIHSGEYNDSVEGFAEAKAKYDQIDGYFYSLLQSEHAKVIEENLAKYPLTDSYIERLGICTYVSKYVLANDIDESHEDISPLLALLGVYQHELEIQSESYKDILEQNTVYFIATVKKMSSVVTYKELKPLYDEALSYFYVMNIDSNEAQKAIEEFYVYQDKLALAEENSAMLIGFANQLRKTSKIRDIYPLLVKCKAVLENVDKDIEGVASALEIYNTKLDEYNNATAPTNAIVEEAGSIVCSTRVFSITNAILEVIKSIFSR